MDFDEYAEFVIKMMSEQTKKSLRDALATSALGIGGESGEVVDIVKKVLYHGLTFDQEVKEKLVRELGDLFFYVAFLTKYVLGLTIEDVMLANVGKLKDRYKTGTFTEAEFLAKERAKNE